MFLNTAVRGGYDGDTGQYLMKWVKFINPTEDILTFCFPEISLTVSWRLDLNEVEKRKYSLIGFEKIHKDDVIEKSVMKTKSNDSFCKTDNEGCPVWDCRRFFICKG